MTGICPRRFQEASDGVRTAPDGCPCNGKLTSANADTRMSVSANNPYLWSVRGFIQSLDLVRSRSVRVHEQSTIAYDVQTWEVRGQATALRANQWQSYPVLHHELATVSPRSGPAWPGFSRDGAQSHIGNRHKLVMHTADVDSVRTRAGPCGRLSPRTPLRQPTARAATCLAHLAVRAASHRARRRRQCIRPVRA